MVHPANVEDRDGAARVLDRRTRRLDRRSPSAILDRVGVMDQANRRDGTADALVKLRIA